VGAPGNFLLMSRLRKGDRIAAVEQDSQDRLCFRWMTVICLEVFEYEGSLQPVTINGVTMDFQLSEAQEVGGDFENT